VEIPSPNRITIDIPIEANSSMGANMIEIRPVQTADIRRCGEIMYRAFKTIAEQHNFPPDFPDAEVTSGMLGMLNDSPDFDGFVAQENGSIYGSIFLSRRSTVGGISVVTVDPESQNRTIGRQLMKTGMVNLADQGHTRQQLIQAGYHSRSLCLYAKLGFVASDLLSTMTGKPTSKNIPDRLVRQANLDDADACNSLCQQVHGFDRAGEVFAAIANDTALVVEGDQGISGYTTGVGFAGHGVGLSNEDLKALITSVDEISGPGLMIPTTNGELFGWCLENGMRLSQQLTLMDTKPSGPANGAYWPGILC
jgi:predicted N-acetyltransferase YhbS